VSIVLSHFSFPEEKTEEKRSVLWGVPFFSTGNCTASEETEEEEEEEERE
jgi:hypothetical protein